MSQILDHTTPRYGAAPSTAELELALITVHSVGDAQDLASEIVSSAGGRLMSLAEAGFIAQVTNRPEAIDVMIAKLQSIARIEVARSGSLYVPKI